MLDCPLFQYLNNSHIEIFDNVSQEIRLKFSKSPVMKNIKKLQAQFCQEANNGAYGSIVEIDVNDILPEKLYNVRYEVLEICNQEGNEFENNVKDTEYFRNLAIRIGEERAMLSCFKYKNLLESINRGYVNNRSNAPILMNRENGTRLDGTHRVSILRYLGHKKISCIMVDEKEYSLFMSTNISRELVKEEMEKLGKWYHAIELLPDIWTRNLVEEQKKNKKRAKEDVMISILSNWSKNRKVLDLGSNNGINSFCAAISGALSVRGVDVNPDFVEKAEFARMIWNVTKPRAGKVMFEVADVGNQVDIFGNCDMLIAGCVIYHLGEGLHNFMEQLRESSVDRVVIQGNVNRLNNLPKISDVNYQTEARMFVNLPRLKVLFEWYGFDTVVYEKAGKYPVMIIERKIH